MKKLFVLFVIILSLCTTMTIFAHPGRTDSAGGHTDHSTGEYHYHHNYPAHQHPNGICPYGNVDKTDSHYSSSDNITSGKSSGDGFIPSEHPILMFLGCVLLYVIFYALMKLKEWISSFHGEKKNEMLTRVILIGIVFIIIILMLISDWLS